MNLKTGDILNCSGHAPHSKMIMKSTKSKFSHTAIVLVVWGQVYIIDAQSNGVTPKPFEEWQKKYKYTIEVRRAPFPIDEQAFYKKAMSKSGLTAYDWEGLLIKQPWKLITGSWRHKGEKEDDKMYCSEFGAWCFDVVESYRMSPQDFYVWQLKNKFLKID